MVKLSEITSLIELKFPPEYAEDFDNIGLLLLTSSSEKKLAPRLAKVEPAKIRNFIKDKMQKE